MQITGRVTQNAQVHNLKDNRSVVNFTVAVNDSYKDKQGQWVNLTAYFRCAYWLNAKVADSLTKGRVVELNGRVSASAWTAKDGQPKADLQFHTSQIKFHGGSSSQQSEETAQDSTDAKPDDLPF